MNWHRNRLWVALPGLAGLLAAVAYGQFVSNSPRNKSPIKTEAVQYLFPEQVSVPAGKLSPVILHFRVAQGLHINSHTPSDKFLIPTDFSIPDGTGVRLGAATYPPGTIISLAFDPSTKLSVYTGEFAIQARIEATPGNHPVQAKLHYQACDQNQCMPPKTIEVPIDVFGK
ncbi:MAG: protein-disulfide reductase DsbD domain-containing protein [Terracidiphilus sp.]